MGHHGAVHRPVRALAALVAVLIVALGAGCTDDGDDPSADPTTTAPDVTGTDDDGPDGTGDEPTPTTLVSDVDWPAPSDPIAAGRTPKTGFAEVAVRVVEGPDGESIVLCVLVAETPDQRRQGLMGVTDLGGYDGMVFVYEEDVENGFWMQDTPLPLSIAYLDAAGGVVSTADMEPCVDGGDCPSYPPDGPFRWTLEVPQGDLDDIGLVEGSDARLEVTGACEPAG